MPHQYRTQRAEERAADITAMWNEGLLMREIAERLGCTKDSLSREIWRLRQRGDIGYRYKGCS